MKPIDKVNEIIERMLGFTYAENDDTPEGEIPIGCAFPTNEPLFDNCDYALLEKVFDEKGYKVSYFLSKHGTQFIEITLKDYAIKP